MVVVAVQQHISTLHLPRTALKRYLDTSHAASVHVCHVGPADAISNYTGVSEQLYVLEPASVNGDASSQTVTDNPVEDSHSALVCCQ